MRKMCIAIAVIVILLSGLIVNFWFQNQRNRQYIIIESLRLDPYQIKNYPSNPNSLKRDLTKPLVVFLGDSRAYEWSAIANMPIEFANRGINGQTTNQVLGRTSAHVASLSPNFVVIQVGINDLKHIATFPNESQSIVTNCKQNIQKIVDELVKEQKTTVILTTIFPVPDSSQSQRSSWSDDVDRAIIEVNHFIKSLKSDRVIILDAATLLADERGKVRQIYQRDFLHLNESGYTMLNKELSKILAN
jgi:lysophospholipase L1-like esterase